MNCKRMWSGSGKSGTWSGSGKRATCTVIGAIWWRLWWELGA